MCGRAKVLRSQKPSLKSPTMVEKVGPYLPLAPAGLEVLGCTTRKANPSYAGGVERAIWGGILKELW